MPFGKLESRPAPIAHREPLWPVFWAALAFCLTAPVIFGTLFDLASTALELFMRSAWGGDWGRAPSLLDPLRELAARSPLEWIIRLAPAALCALMWCVVHTGRSSPAPAGLFIPFAIFVPLLLFFVTSPVWAYAFDEEARKSLNLRSVVAAHQRRQPARNRHFTVWICQFLRQNRRMDPHQCFVGAGPGGDLHLFSAGRCDVVLRAGRGMLRDLARHPSDARSIQASGLRLPEIDHESGVVCRAARRSHRQAVANTGAKRGLCHRRPVGHSRPVHDGLCDRQPVELFLSAHRRFCGDRCLRTCVRTVARRRANGPYKLPGHGRVHGFRGCDFGRDPAVRDRCTVRDCADTPRSGADIRNPGIDLAGFAGARGQPLPRPARWVAQRPDGG